MFSSVLIYNLLFLINYLLFVIIYYLFFFKYLYNSTICFSFNIYLQEENNSNKSETGDRESIIHFVVNENLLIISQVLFPNFKLRKSYYVTGTNMVHEIVPRNIVSLLVTFLTRDSKTTVNCATMLTVLPMEFTWDSTWYDLAGHASSSSSCYIFFLLLTTVTSYSINYRFDWLSSIVIRYKRDECL